MWHSTTLLRAQLDSKISKRSLQKDGKNQLKARPAESILKFDKRIVIDTRGIRPLEEIFKNRFINRSHMFQGMIVPVPENNGVTLWGTWQPYTSTFSSFHTINLLWGITGQNLEPIRLRAFNFVYFIYGGFLGWCVCLLWCGGFACFKFKSESFWRKVFLS